MRAVGGGDEAVRWGESEEGGGVGEKNRDESEKRIIITDFFFTAIDTLEMIPRRRQVRVDVISRNEEGSFERVAKTTNRRIRS